MQGQTDAVKGSDVSHGNGGDGDGNRSGGVDRDGVRAGANVNKIPASIVRAVCSIMATVDAIKKSQKNQHGNYMFSSTDDFYAALARKMGEVGVICWAMEEQCEIRRFEQPLKEHGKVVMDKEGKPVTQMVQWVHVIYSFVWATETDTWTDPKARRSLYVQVTGPQTFQSAQSFVEKSYLRSSFKVPSGDMDLDSMPQADSEEDQIALSGNGAKRKSSAEGKRDGTVKIFNEIRAAIQQSINPEMLQHIRTVHSDDWNTMAPRWATVLDEEYETRMADFHAVGAN